MTNPAVQADPQTDTGRTPPVSVVILTYNEEINIAECIESCSWWCDDIHVLDSGSSDATCSIAEKMSVAVHFHPFTSFGAQRNWAIDHIPCKHPWHFHLDADERFTPELVEEMRRQLGADGNGTQNAAYLVPSKIIFLGKWLRRSGSYPAYQMRLFRHGQCRFIDFGHGQREQTTGTIARLREPYIHLSFSKGLVEWFTKHNQYSSREAHEGKALLGTVHFSLRALMSRDPLVRRRAFKDMSFFLRGRAVWRFLYSYVLRWGWLDGTAGFHYCAMISMYEYWIEVKLREQDRDWLTQTTRLAQRLEGNSP